MNWRYWSKEMMSQAQEELFPGDLTGQVAGLRLAGRRAHGEFDL